MTYRVYLLPAKGETVTMRRRFTSPATARYHGIGYAQTLSNAKGRDYGPYIDVVVVTAEPGTQSTVASDDRIRKDGGQ
jgi:hypothetical protein